METEKEIFQRTELLLGSDAVGLIGRHPHPQYNKYLDPRKFNRFTLENGNIVWGKNWDLIFPVEQLHSGLLA